MESDLDPHQELLAAERAAAAPYVSYPATPWFPLAAGAWATALVAAIGYVDSRPWKVVLIVALVALESAFLGWYRRKRGTAPSLRSVPREFRTVFGAYAVGVAIVIAVIAVCVLWAPWVVTLIATLVLVTAGVWGYERLYERAATATRNRLS